MKDHIVHLINTLIQTDTQKLNACTWLHTSLIVYSVAR